MFTLLLTVVLGVGVSAVVADLLFGPEQPATATSVSHGDQWEPWRTWFRTLRMWGRQGLRRTRSGALAAARALGRGARWLMAALVLRPAAMARHTWTALRAWGRALAQRRALHARHVAHLSRQTLAPIPTSPAHAAPGAPATGAAGPAGKADLAPPADLGDPVDPVSPADPGPDPGPRPLADPLARTEPLTLADPPVRWDVPPRVPTPSGGDAATHTPDREARPEAVPEVRDTVAGEQPGSGGLTAAPAPAHEPDPEIGVTVPLAVPLWDRLRALAILSLLVFVCGVVVASGLLLVIVSVTRALSGL